ncbi:uncharacterized protein [Gossypium hirsutum]|uniref:Uncharacterized protein n=1 Tax=Gossypium hirsutum TaxID=3635 RepID=A0ABM3AMN4_GOSHI|nr:uncharacterized protein LOC121220745 [Gossypium hirsutum]
MANQTLKQLAAPNLAAQPPSITYPALDRPLKLNLGFMNFQMELKRNKSSSELFLSRYKDWRRTGYIICCQHHISEQLLVQYFYEGLTPKDRGMIDATSGGALVDKTPEQARYLIANIVQNTQQFSLRRSDLGKRMDEGQASLMEAQVANLTAMEGEANAVFPNQRRYDPYLATYNEGWRDHPNLRYQNRATPPGFEQFQALETVVKQLQTRVSSTDVNLGNLQAQVNNRLRSQSVTNPRDNVSAVTLRSGKELRPILKKIQNSKEESETVVKRVRFGNRTEENLAMPKADSQSSQAVPRKAEKTHLPQSTVSRDTTNLEREAQTFEPQIEGSLHINDQQQSYEPKAPFPQHLRKEKSDDVNAEILETFRKVQVNIPLIDAIKQVPRYANFLKELCTSKRKLIGNEKISLGENVSAVFQKKLPTKCKDPGMFSIPCKIGDLKLDRAILDLGASINVMPRNKSNAYPDGILENVLVQVNELVFPTDFYVLDMGPNDNSIDVPLLLGRPFLKTARTKIDLHKGNLTMEFDGEIIKFNIFDAMRYPTDINSMFTLDVIDNFVQDVYELGDEDELKSVLTKGFFDIDEHEFVVSDSSIDSVCALDSPKLT